MYAYRYSKAIEIITTAGRPVRIGFRKPSPVVRPADALSALPPSGAYAVVFENSKLGLGLQAGDDPRDLPIVSSAPTAQALPRVGDLLESVNGITIAGSPDCYEQAIELITSAGRPVTLGFLPAPPTPGLGGVYDVEFTTAKLGLGLRADDDPRELPIVSSAPEGRALPKEGHLLVAINGYQLAGQSDTYAKSIEIITTASRPITMSFRAPGGTSAVASAVEIASGAAAAAAAMEGLSPPERVNVLFDMLNSTKNGENFCLERFD